MTESLAAFTIPGNGNHPEQPRPLNDEDRAHGYVTLELIGAWQYWVKRRVETIEVLSESTVAWRHSVDFRLRPWFPPAVVSLGESESYHYLPLTLLEKHVVPKLDLRDESGRTLPLLTRRKGAAIAAATLSALAKTSVVSHVRERSAVGLGSSLPSTDIRELAIPESLEQEFYRLAYAGPCPDPVTGDPGGPALLAGFLLGVDDHAPISLAHQWAWKKEGSETGAVWRSSASEAEWRVHLALDLRFRAMMADFARLFLILVPIRADETARRIIKIAYQRHVRVPQLGPTTWLRSRTPGAAQGRYAAVKDVFEGILPYAGDDWNYRGGLGQGIDDTPPQIHGLSLIQKAAQAVGWVPKTMEFETLAIGHGGSYHFEFEAPRGLQIRQATLTTEWPGGGPRRTVMGAQSLQRVHLYLGDLPPNAAGKVSVRLKVSPTTLVRGAWFAALLSTALLFLGYVKLDVLVNRTQGNLGPTLALFLLLPGLIAGLMTRGEEHPMTTSMLFGLRCLCGFVAALPITAAFLALAFRGWEHFSDAWMAILGLSVWALIVLSFTWLLAARRRPDGSAP
jgi:hypothetical protein